MGEKLARPYGSWKSPITSDLIISGSIALGEPTADGNDIYWVEGRPSEAGRYCIVRQTPDGTVIDVTPPQFNARTRVHEYGGGAYLAHEGKVYFSNFSDGRVYVQDGFSEPRALTPESSLRYADFAMDASRQRLICVCEDHTDTSREAVNKIVAVSLDGGEPVTMIEGSDFYSSPRLSPDGRVLAWQSWDHPNMPWDGSELWIAGVDDSGSLKNRKVIAGGKTESVFQPEWSPDGLLYFVSDRTGWWNLYRLRDGKIEPVVLMEAEFGAPQWVFATTTYCFVAPDTIFCSFDEKGLWKFGLIDTKSLKLERLDLPYTEFRSVSAGNGFALFAAGSATEPISVIRYDVATRSLQVLRRATNVKLDQGYLSIPDSIEYPTSNGLTAFGIFYRPKNADFDGTKGEKPPLIVISHGGPTAAASTALSLGIQFWTSHGFAVLDVNYGGSTGYGRSYRERLNGTWGVVDVEDCINGAKYLADQGEVDPDRLIIRGGSAGGYTTLAALTFHNVFKAGASYYGVSDLEALEDEGHKFESRYTHSLVAPYPEGKQLYVERSPIHYVHRISCPLILFQGLEDKVVPPNQAEMMFDAAKAKGLPVAYVPFEGEQHGFRRAENIKRSLDGELYFYSKVFGFDLADPVEPVEIENLRTS